MDGLIVELPTRSRSTSDNTSLLNPNCRVGAMRLDPTEGEMPALLVCDLTLGGCRLTGAKEARRAVRRVRPSHSSQLIGLLAGVVLIMGGLAYFPAVSLVPVTEQVAMNRGIH